MRRTEFSDDVIMYSTEPIVEDDDTSQDEEEFELDPESWQDWHSEHLLNMYMSLISYCEDTGTKFMNGISFNTFCNFISGYSK